MGSSFCRLIERLGGSRLTKILTCTIIKTQPNEVVSDIHDRMPAIIRQEDEQIWLDRDRNDADLLHSLLVPFDPGQMKAYPVSVMVGSPKNDVHCLQTKICLII